MSEYDAVLKNARWEFNDMRSPNITGEIYEDKKGRFQDGYRLYTSTVLAHLPGGVFQTRNTKYLVLFDPAFSPAEPTT
jgi:hypothetical protein